MHSVIIPSTSAVMDMPNRPSPKAPYIPPHGCLITLIVHLEVPDLCFQVGQGTEIAVWTTRAQ